MGNKTGNYRPWQSWSQDCRKMSAQDFVIKYFGLLVMLSLVPFTINDFYSGRHLLGLADLAAISLIGIDFVCIIFYKRVLIPRTFLLSGICIVLWFVVAKQGGMGIYWSYPFIAAMYFVLPHRTAFIMNLVFLAGLYPLVYNSVGEAESYRVMVSMVLNGLVACIFSYIVEAQRQYLSQQAITDPLTGAYNRRYLHKRMENLIEECNRYDRKPSKILFDVDHFKDMNDRFGHEYGDEILSKITTIIRSRIRSSDQVFRLGGDEFVVLLPDTGVSEVMMIAENLRRLIEDLGKQLPCPLTISCGVSEYMNDEPLSSWLNRTDMAMYEAKQRGRNRIHIAGYRAIPTSQDASGHHEEGIVV